MKYFYRLIITCLVCLVFSDAFAQPSNSSCGTAIPLTVTNGTCSTSLYTNVGAPSAGLPAVPSCWIPNTASNTVWFSFLATVADVEATTNTNAAATLTNTQIAAFSGSCGSLVQIACQEDIFTAGGVYQTDIIMHGLTIGNTYYLAVDGNGSSTGTFGICLTQALPAAPPGPAQDCETAQYLCTAANVVVPDAFGGVGYTITSPSCFGAPGERSSTWYSFTAATSGILEFTIQPSATNTATDYDFAVFNTTAGCPGTQVACDWSPAVPVGAGTGTNPGGCYDPDPGNDVNPCVAPIPVIAGQTYSILVDRFSASSIAGFTLDFTGTTATFGSPVPAFSTNTACVGSSTQFTNTTTGANAYNWNFGDGFTSNAQYPIHTYATAGTYNVSLSITTVPGGCQNSITKTVTVSPLPAVTVSAASPVCSGGNAVFTLTGTANATVTYNINGGAAQTVTLSAAGTATVTVTGIAAGTTLNTTLVSTASTSILNASAATGSTTAVNAAGPISALGTVPTAANSALVNATDSMLLLTLPQTVFTGTALTISIARSNTSGNVTITDGINSQTFSAAPNNILQQIIFTAGAPVSSIKITRNAGNTWVDGLQYTYSSGCSAVSAQSATVAVTTAPAVPSVTTPVTYCQGATAIALNATGTNLLWYTVATGGTGSPTAPTPLTGTAGPTIYYVSQTIGCEGPRASITVNITATPAAPTVSTPVTYCQGATAIPLSATGTNLLWYNAATGGTGSATAPTPSTAATGSTNYYVSQTPGTCESPRALIAVTINALPAAPTVTTPITYCQGATASPLTATGTNLLWYTTASGGTGTATAPTPSTGATGSVNYYVTQAPGTCEGPRALITVTVDPVPAAPAVSSPVTYCEGATAIPLAATGTNLLWYTTAAGGTGSATAPTPSTASAGSANYYVSQTSGSCEGSRALIVVTINALPAAPAVTTPVTYCQGATASALTATGTNLLWYNAATGGTGSATAPTPSTAATGSTNYYVSQTNGSCEGSRALILVTINALPAAPAVTTPVTYCQGATASALTATGTNLLWYNTATGGTGSATAPTPSTAATGSTNYYVSQTNGSCEGSRALIVVTINALPAAPAVTTPVTYCQGSPASPLTATGTNLLWYNTATGGTGSATAPTPTTAATGSINYYVSQTPGTCESPRALIVVTINALPTAPTVTTPVIYCQGATASALTATGTNLLWYNTATGGTGSATAPTPTTAATGSINYYVSQTPGTCESPRALIVVTINALPTAPTVTTPVIYCQGATASALTATGTNLLWYNTATGGTGSATAPTPSTGTVGSTNYYVSQTPGTCESPRALIVVTINALPAAPTVSTPVIYCQGTTASALTATGTNLLWYNVATGGIGSATAPTPSTGTVGSTNYYVSQTPGTCESPRALIVVAINALPAAPTVTTPVVYCQGATASALTATGTNLLWYNTATGGTGSATAPTPSTATTGSTNYYVSQTPGTCESPRALIVVTINALPAAPTVTTPVTYCQGVTAVPLTATGTNLLWYNAATGGTGSVTAPTPSTGTVGSTNYYVSQTTGTCESPRALIAVTINALPAAPTVTTPVVYCQGATASALTATGTNLLWYNTATGGTGSATAPTPSTATTGSTNYYVSQTPGTCESPRALIVVTINALPAAPTVTTPVTYCQGVTAVPLTATGTNLLWYNAATGGTGSVTAPTPSTGTVGSTNYYVSQTTGTCESPRALIAVTINALPAAPTVTTPITYCQGATASPLTATGTNLLWYTTASGGTGSATAPTPSTGATGSVNYYVTQAPGTCEGPRALITVTVDPVPAAPAVSSPVTYCEGATAIPLAATGTNLLWYTTAAGGTGSATAPTPSTASAGSANYYVSQTSGSCEGSRALIVVTINALPAAPAVTTPVTYCQGATASALTATGTNLLWYTTATGGTGSATAPTPSTAATGSANYYVSQTPGTCESPRSLIIVTVNTLPAAPTVTTPVTYCQGATALPLTATGTNLLWYTVATGGTASSAAPIPSTATIGSTTYYVSQTTGSCEGPRTSVIVTINAVPAAPTVSSPVTYCQNATATTLTATGTNLLWYTTASGGTGSATAPTPSATATGSTNYYVSQTTGTCESPRATIVVTVNTLPAAPTVSSPVTYCQGATATSLTATGTNLLWYNTASGGTGSSTAPTPSTVTVGSTNYYVSQTTGTCESPRALIVVTVNTLPAAPAVNSPLIYCQGTTAGPLTATGINLLWYTTATGGTGSATAPTPSTGTAGSTNYYVSQSPGTCEGPRALIVVTVNALPAAPIVTTPVIYCEGATTNPLTATGTNLLWYNAATGGTGSATAPTPSTAATGSTSYYVSQTNGSCEGSRALIIVTINALPAAPAVTTPITYCQGATASALTATGTNLLWYNAATGGTGSATAPTPSTGTVGSTNYYVSQTPGTCESPRALIAVTINALPAAPTVTTPITYCQGATASALTATGTNLLWYNAATGGTGSATAPTPSTAATGSTNYYVSQTPGTCESPRALIAVTINALPAAPTVTTPITYCQGATASPLTATGTNLLWYTTASGGTGTATAPTPSTGATGSVNYYVTQAPGTCEGPRALITVTVDPVPAAPAVSSPVTYCEGATAIPLAATGTNLLWYTTAAGGTGSATAPTPSTASAGSANYYVSQTSGTCEGPRASIVVTVNTIPAAPVVTSPVSYCQGTASSALTATGTNLLWYSTATGGTGSATTPTASTATAGTTLYYVSQSAGSCESPRALISVTINPAPAVNIGIDTALCEGDSMHFIPVVIPEADSYTWKSLTAGVPNSTISSIHTKETTVGPVNSAQYVLHAVYAGCAAEDTALVNVRWKPVVDAGINAVICPQDSALLTATVTHFNGASADISYIWAPADSLTTPDAVQTWAHPAHPTWYRFTAITTKAVYGCDFNVYDSVKLVVQPPVHAFAGNDTIAVSGQPHQLYGSGGTYYYWSSPTALINDPTHQNPTTVLTADANFFLKVQDAVGCTGYDTIFVKLYDGPALYIPGAFSPNGDGLNDILRPIPSGISSITYFRIYDRYGTLMFETNQYLKGWDGTYRGKPQVNGTYVWIAEAVDRNRHTINMKGTVVLVR